MRIFLAIITISLCLSKISFAQGPFSDASKGITAQVLLHLLSMMGQYTWHESDECQGVQAPNEEDPPPPSPSPSPFGRQGDANNGFWLIPPTKSPSPSPKPHASLVPLTTTEHPSGSVDRIAIHRLLNPASNENADTSRAQVARLLLELAHTGNAPFGAHASLESTEDVVVHEGIHSKHRASLAQAKRLGIVNGLKLVGKGHPLPTDDYLRGWYKVHYPMATDAQVDAYMGAYKSAYAENHPSATDGEVEACVEYGQLLVEQAEVFNGMHEAASSMDANDFIADNNEIRDEAQEPLSFAALVSVHLSGLSDEPTPDIRAGLLALARFEGTSIEERVAAAGLLYLNDGGDFKMAAEEVLKGLFSNGDLQPSEHIVEYVRSVLWNHEGFANELVAGLPRVLAELNAGMSRADDVILYEGRPLSAVDTRQSQPESRRKRTVDQVYEGSVSNNAHKKQRVGKRNVSVRGDNEGLTQEEKSVLSAGRKKGTTDGKRGKNLSEKDLRVFYLKTNHGKMPPNLFDVYLRGYAGANKAANDQKANGYIRVFDAAKETPIGQAECSGCNNGSAAARHGSELKSEEELKAWYKKKHPEASDDAVSAYAKSYIKSYNAFKATPVQQAGHLGRTRGSQAAGQGSELKSEEELKAWYKKKHADANDDAAVAYAKRYIESYCASRGTPIEQAERLGRTRGVQAVGIASELKSKEELKAWYKNKNPNASDDVASAYAESYIKAYDAAKGTPIEQAERAGYRNGAKAGQRAAVLKSVEALKTWYQSKYPEASDDVLDAYAKYYLKAYDAEKDTLIEHAGSLGERNGAKAAGLASTLKSQAELETAYKKDHPEASDDAVKTYVERYLTVTGTSIEQAECLGHVRGANALSQGTALKSEEALKTWYKRNYPEAGDDAALAYAKSYAMAYDIANAPTKLAKFSGRCNGHAAARQGTILKSEEDLKIWYKKNKDPNASDDVLDAYAKNYLKAYNAQKSTPVERAERSGRKNGTQAAVQGFRLKSEEELKAAYRKERPDASGDALDAYAKSYTMSYLARNKKP